MSSKKSRNCRLTLSSIRSTDRIKWLSYMFRYCGEGFHSELRSMFSRRRPGIDSWNWAYAVGRVFSSSGDFELFLDFLAAPEHCRPGFPAYPDRGYTKMYWWSFFRCLCYYPDSIDVPEEEVLAALRMLTTFIENADWSRIARDRYEKNCPKFCLCAVLYSLRMREKRPDFLQPGAELCDTLATAVARTIPKQKYPQAMLQHAQDPTGEGLNGLVLRFLRQTAGEKDLAAIEGLTTSMV